MSSSSRSGFGATAPPSPDVSVTTEARAGAALRSAAWLGAAAVFVLVLVVARWGPLIAVDRFAATVLHREAVASPGWTRANRVLTDWVWDPWAMRALLVLLVGYLLWRGAKALAGWVATTAIAGTVLQQGMKAAVGRERPSWPDPVDSAQFAAFPSGHAMSVVVAGGLVLWLLAGYGVRAASRWAAYALVIASVIGVGWTRVYLGVHWLSDVLAGWLLGGALVALAAGLYGRWATPSGSSGSSGLSSTSSGPSARS